ncbi:hypothetical protein OPIT5_10675 [Opitutaceae bacterium TAV5]|nr:hypothetical protein OPIT5_10675 [Opitutaceae bacterium TAV5]
MKTKLALLSLVTGLAMALVAPLAPAQTSDGAKPKKPAASSTRADPVQKRLDQFVSTYQPDAAQQAKVKTILTDEAAAIKALDADLDKAERKKQVDALRKETNAKIVALLTPAQLEIREQRRVADDNKKRLVQFTKDYQLDTAQQAKVKAILDEQAAARKTIDADDSLDKAARTKKVRALNNEANKKITALLTPEQLEIQKKLREEAAARNKK